jgi:hypothetical protein
VTKAFRHKAQLRGVQNVSLVASGGLVDTRIEALNGWQRLWVSATIIYLGIILVGAYMKQPTNDDIQIAEVLPFISTSTLKLMQATGKDVAWRETVEDGITISIHAQLDVQIMKPGYEEDPEVAKVVPRDQWFLRPSAPPPAA